MNRPPDTNVVLIGMPGAGKSTLGVLLAKRLSMGFVDTDLLIQSRTRQRLQALLATRGIEGFCALEAEYVCSLDSRREVIATGGSVVYSAAAMAHLRKRGYVVFIDVPLDVLAERLGDLDARGVVHRPDQSLPGLYAERMPLYRQHADATVAGGRGPHDTVVQAILAALPPALRGAG